MFKTTSRIALLVSTAILSSTSVAQTSSSVSISNFSYQLIDLDATDGIDPSISFTHSSFVASSTAPVANGGLLSGESYQTGAAAPVLKSSNVSRGATTYAYVSGQALGAGGYSVGAGEYYSNAWQSSMFTLSANTALLVSAHAGAGAVGNLDWPEYVSGSLSMQIINSQHASPFSQISFYSKSAYSYNGGPRSLDEDFSLYFANSASATMYGTLDMNVGAYGNVAAVPEPEAYGMMLLGLGVIGGLARRRALKNKSA